jgi:hypothetical protein
MTMVPIYLFYRVIDVNIYSSSRASLWKVLQPDSAKSSVFNTSVSSIGRETHCCQGHRSLPTVEEWLLFWYKPKTKFVSPAYNEPRAMA